MIERVVVGWDGSQAAAEAMEWAARRSRRSGALQIVRVLDDGNVCPDQQRTGGTVAGTRMVLDEEVDRVAAAHPRLQVSSVLVVGRREDELERLAEPGTLLVLGTEERVGPRLRFRFSLAVRLAARARGAVAVVPDGAEAPAEGPVVVGVDGSAASTSAALLAADEAALRGAPLVVVHAWWEAADADLVQPLDADLLAGFERSHARILEECAGIVEHSHPDLPLERRLVHAPRSEALLAAAEGASSLVVGKHSRAVARTILLGSLSRNILLDTWVPTIVAGLPTEDEQTGSAELAARSAGGRGMRQER